MLDRLHPTLLPVALIHDLEYHEGGDHRAFRASNERFVRNGVICADAAFRWYDPRRYWVRHKARQFAQICADYGWKGFAHDE